MLFSRTVILLALCSVSVLAQDPSTTALPKSDVFLDVSFKNGNSFIDDIQPQELTIKRAGNAQVVSIESAGEFPLQVAIAMDTSGSQRAFVRQNFEIYSKIIDLLPLRAADSACLISFSNSINLLQGLTSNKMLLRRGLGDIVCSGPTGFYDAIFYASSALGNQGEFRKAMIAITDGEDNGSYHGKKEAFGEAIHNSVRIFVLTRENPFGFQRPYHSSDIMKTGGNISLYKDLKSGLDAVPNILDELAHLKRITFSGLTAEKLKSGIEISVSRKGVKAFYPSAIR
jgi:hypothetical protein